MVHWRWKQKHGVHRAAMAALPFPSLSSADFLGGKQVEEEGAKLSMTEMNHMSQRLRYSTCWIGLDGFFFPSSTTSTHKSGESTLYSMDDYYSSWLYVLHFCDTVDNE